MQNNNGRKNGWKTCLNTVANALAPVRSERKPSLKGGKRGRRSVLGGRDRGGGLKSAKESMMTKKRKNIRKKKRNRR